MGSEFHRPTYTLRNLDKSARPYNPTEVRLYGLYGPFNFPPVAAQNLDFNIPGYKVHLSIEPSGAAHALPPAGGPSIIAISTKEADQNVLLLSFNNKGEEALEAGIIFGYAYEGHCYDLPKPKIMLIPAIGIEVPPDDCGYDMKPTEEYRVWVVDKLEKCIEIEVDQGFVEQLVLEANLPGKRSPNMYAGRMALAHRSGRLSE